jgi:hypothetical protein
MGSTFARPPQIMASGSKGIHVPTLWEGKYKQDFTSLTHKLICDNNFPHQVHHNGAIKMVRFMC